MRRPGSAPPSHERGELSTGPYRAGTAEGGASRQLPDSARAASGVAPGDRTGRLRFCTRNAPYAMLYTAVEFATAFVETVVRGQVHSAVRSRNRAVRDHGAGPDPGPFAAGNGAHPARPARGRVRPGRCADRCSPRREPRGGGRLTRRSTRSMPRSTASSMPPG